MCENEKQNEERIKKLAAGVLSLARDDILVSMRFLDLALATLDLKEGSRGLMELSGKSVLYDAGQLLKAYEREQNLVKRTLLHVLFHAVFSHPYGYEKLERELWDMAADMAAENVILSLELPGFSLENDDVRRDKLRIWREDAGGLTAEKLYQYMKKNGVSEGERKEMIRLFQRDRHHAWEKAETMEISLRDFQKISERIKADLKSFSRLRAGEEALTENLSRATKDRYDYGKILRQFVVTGEDMTLNDEEFDYVYYTYGLTTYGNMPLVEPLEYKDVKKVREFVIALDTSASCKGVLVRGFLNKTYSLLKSQENFFQKINVHIIQCDNQVRTDTKITCDEDFEAFLKNGKLQGYGGTDFRPVFDYVEELTGNGEFENLKGLIYFTDGYGTYPEKMPPYRVIFAFLSEDEYRMKPPAWCMKVVLEEEDLS